MRLCDLCYKNTSERTIDRITVTQDFLENQASHQSAVSRRQTGSVNNWVGITHDKDDFSKIPLPFQTEPKVTSNKIMALNQESLTNVLLENPTGNSECMAFIIDLIKNGMLKLFPKAKFTQRIMWTKLLINHYFNVFSGSIQIISSKIKEHHNLLKLVKIIDRRTRWKYFSSTLPGQQHSPQLIVAAVQKNLFNTWGQIISDFKSSISALYIRLLVLKVKVIPDHDR